ncbi:MAG: PstS family phosphate ABC transporter substrate-binding protein [Chloroflexi bacterium]|nr:PstS family phosphate ABC transporter substrate-binding protein [Chloroflexota bacterium]
MIGWTALRWGGIVVIAGFAMGCGGGSDDGAFGAPQLSGTVEIDGSSTVFPVSEAVAEEFRKVEPKVRVNVGVSGTGAGFKRFNSGEIDISDASRPIKDAEAEAAEQNGIAYLEIRIAIDGLSVVVSPDNDFVECMTVDELRLLWKPKDLESSEPPVERWSDIRPEWPDRKISLYGPGTDSGTFDYFTEEIVGDARSSRSDYTASEDDNVLVRGISGDRNSLGYFGYSYYSENPDKLKLVAIDDGSGCVTPTQDTIEKGMYTPLSRPLFIYVNKKSLEREEVRVFVEFYLENAAVLAQEVGYVGLSPEEYESALELVRQSAP